MDMSFNAAIPADRQQWVLSFVQEHGSAQIRELAIQCGVSEATIRRDLDELAALGYLARTHGGAIQNSTSYELDYNERFKKMVAEKKRIAQRAAAFVNEGSSVFLDAGSTNFFISQQLANHKNLTVVTNGLDIAHSMVLHPTSSLVVAGGMRREHFHVLVGPIPESIIQDLHVDISFLGCDAMSPVEGVYCASFIELSIKKLIAKCGTRLIIGADHSKFEHKGFAKICKAEDVDVIITDDGVKPATLDGLREHIRTVITV